MFSLRSFSVLNPLPVRISAWPHPHGIRADAPKSRGGLVRDVTEASIAPHPSIVRRANIALSYGADSTLWYASVPKVLWRRRRGRRRVIKHVANTGIYERRRGKDC